MSAFSKPGLEQSFVLTLKKEDLQKCVITSPTFEFIDRKFEDTYRPSLWKLQWNGPKGGLEVYENALSCTTDYGRPPTYRVEKYEDFTFEVEVIRLDSESAWDGRLIWRGSYTSSPSAWNSLNVHWDIQNDELLSLTDSFPTAHCDFRVILRAGNAIAAARQEARLRSNERRLAHVQMEKVKLQWIGLHRAKHPFDVVFVFPESNRQLWENADFLRASSAYWKDLLGSGFAESLLCDENEDKAQESDGQKDMETEDGEDGSSTLFNSAIRSCAVPVHRIVIAEDIPQHFEAFRAVLGWLRSPQIDFLALETTTSAADKPKEATKEKKRRSRKSKSSRTSALPKTSAATASANSSDLPDKSDEWSDSSEANDILLSVCPRVVYRLADYLRLNSLRELAFEDLKGKITAENVASELFSSFTEAYEEVHSFELDFAVRNWAKVKATPAMKMVERRIANRDPEMQGAAATLYKISMRLINV